MHNNDNIHELYIVDTNHTLSCRELSTLTQPHPHARKRKHGRSLTVMPWTTTDEFNVVPKTQRMSLASFPGQSVIPRPEFNSDPENLSNAGNAVESRKYPAWEAVSRDSCHGDALLSVRLIVAALRYFSRNARSQFNVEQRLQGCCTRMT